MLKIDDYHLWREQTINTLSGVTGVTEVFCFGNIKCPGVSDLDFWVIYDANLNEKQLSKAIAILRKKCPISLDVCPIPKSLLHHIHYLLPNRPNINLLAPSEKIRQALAYTFILMWMPTKIADMVRYYQKKKVTPKAVRVLYSLRYTLELMVKVHSLDAYRVSMFIEKMDNYRRQYIRKETNWISFEALFSECLNLLKEGSTFPRLKDEIKIDPLEKELWLVMGWSVWIKFSPVSKPAFALSTIPLLHKILPHDLKPVVIELPSCWIGIIAHFYAEKNLIPYLPKTMRPLPALIKKSDIIQKQAFIFSQFITSSKLKKISKGIIISPFITKYGKISTQIIRGFISVFSKPWEMKP